MKTPSPAKAGGRAASMQQGAFQRNISSLCLDGCAGENVSSPGSMRNLRPSCFVSSLEAVIAHRSGRCQTNMHDGSPALEFVVAVAVKKIRGADGRASGGGFDRGKRGVVVYDIVGQQDFLASSSAHVECRKII